MAGLNDVFALSLRPDAALELALGEVRIHLTSVDIEYTGKIIIHACDYQSEDKQEAETNIIQSGWNLDEVPTNAILGWAKLKTIKLYTESEFKLDKSFHKVNDFNLLKAQQQWDKVYGYVIENHHYLPLPIYGVNKDYTYGDWWTPEDPFDVLCFKRAFDSQSIDVETVEL